MGFDDRGENIPLINTLPDPNGSDHLGKYAASPQTKDDYPQTN